MIRAATLLTLVVAAACGSGGNSAPPDAAPPYEVAILTHAHIGSHGDQPDFQKAHGAVDFGGAPVEQATLIVDLESPCYPFDKWQTDKPPAGQRWPADCDAFDRNFELTLDEPAAPGGTPALELGRLITPFGGPLHQEIDVTDLVNAKPGPHDLQVYIATWSDAAGMVSGSNGGWSVSAKLALVPGTPPRHVLAVIPIVNGSITVAAPLAPVGFDVPAGVTSARLEYRATGHGGGDDPSGACIGPAEEFCQRVHHVTIDGAELSTPQWQPWRDDCQTLCTDATYAFPGGKAFHYCKENPGGAIDSVRAPRANWCPGSLTPPKTYDPAALHVAGPHTFGATVDAEHKDGMWRVSAALYLYGD
jgi:hypothetical protein